MEARDLLVYESGFANAGQAQQAGLLDALVLRLAGEGAANLLQARAEVISALRASGGAVPQADPLDDAVRPASIPSVAAGRLEDRVLAEIDQDGFSFAVDPLDEPHFNRRAYRVERQQNKVEVVLLEGRVCIRKRFCGFCRGARLWGDRPVPALERARRSLWVNLGLYLYAEAAALLRLRDLPFVPKLRAVDLEGRAIYLDCIAGESLRSIAAASGAAVHDRDLAKDPAFGQLSARELERREVALLEGAAGGGFRQEIAGMIGQINARGVAPLDIKLGNFIRGSATGRLYWIDFEISRLATQPRYEAGLALQREVLETVFQLSRLEDRRGRAA